MPANKENLNWLLNYLNIMQPEERRTLVSGFDPVTGKETEGEKAFKISPQELAKQLKIDPKEFIASLDEALHSSQGITAYYAVLDKILGTDVAIKYAPTVTESRSVFDTIPERSSIARRGPMPQGHLVWFAEEPIYLSPAKLADQVAISKSTAPIQRSRFSGRG